MQIEDTKPRWGIVWGIFLLLAALAAVPFFYMNFQPKNLPTYQIQNFIGKVEVYAKDKKAWVPAQRGSVLGAKDRIRTGPQSEIDLQVPEQIAIRLKENSEIEVQSPALLEKSVRFRLHLLRGILLGSTEKKFEGEKLEITTPTLVAAVRGTLFQMEVRPDTQESSVRVLKGSVAVKSRKTRKTVLVRALEKTEVGRSAPPLAPVRVTRQEWDQMKEAYELIRTSAALEAAQMDLSKQAGNLFEYVFDHGTFYTPKFGFAEREFIRDEATGKVYLKIDYDVFPTGSFVGVYMKIRGLNVQKYKGLGFQARVKPEEGYPNAFRIELKSGTGVVRAFAPREFKETWTPFKFPAIFRKPVEITEVTLVFSNEKVGNHKKGTIYLEDISLEPVA